MGTSVPELKNVSTLVKHYRLWLTQYMDKRLIVHLNGERKIIGVLRGYDVSIVEGFWVMEVMNVIEGSGDGEDELHNMNGLIWVVGGVRVVEIMLPSVI